MTRGSFGRRPLIVAALLALAASRPAAADLLADPRYAVGAKSRLDQFIRRGADAKEAEAIFRRLSDLDAERWVAEWSRLAEPWERRAPALEREGRNNEARDAYLKAQTYYSIAKFPVLNHPAKRAAYRKCVEMYLKAAKHFDPPLERVAIPFDPRQAGLAPASSRGEGKEIIGYLTLPKGVVKPPVVIATGGVDVYKEDRDVSDILGIGAAAFSMDMPGAGESPVWYTPEAHRIYSATLDYLEKRPDLDGRRIAIVGRSYGGYWGGKMAHVESRRLKAAVQWGGPIHHSFQAPWLRQLQDDKLYLWSLLDSMIYASNLKDLAELRTFAPTLSLKTAGWLDKPSAPLLGVNGAKDAWLSIDDVYVLAEGGEPKAIRVYPEGGHMGRGDPAARTIGVTVMRWLATRLGSSQPGTASSNPRTVRAAMFGGEPPPLFVAARENGLFEKFGTKVDVQTRWTSEDLRAGLASGKFDIVHSLADNAVAVAEDLRVPVVILMGSGGGGGGGTHLVAQPHIKSIEDLRGTTVLVDSPDTGHALALRKMLRMKGLEAGRDYKMLPFGQTQKRFEALKANKEYAATMMGYDEEARQAGLRSLGAAADMVGRYQVSAIYARRDWVEANPGAAVGYLAGYLHALRWTRDPANREAVIAALAGQSDAASARKVYERTFSGRADAAPTFDVEAFRNGLALRAEIEGTWGGKPPEPERYYDTSYLKKALALLEK
ncbi:MAG TPA: alpha/beta hydrolase [Vicinamibacterales bacterium]|nr:alpha/beta hydrolase [Vicinamibacterales bacterium]